MKTSTVLKDCIYFSLLILMLSDYCPFPVCNFTVLASIVIARDGTFLRHLYDFDLTCQRDILSSFVFFWTNLDWCFAISDFRASILEDLGRIPRVVLKRYRFVWKSCRSDSVTPLRFNVSGLCCSFCPGFLGISKLISVTICHCCNCFQLQRSPYFSSLKISKLIFKERNDKYVLGMLILFRGNAIPGFILIGTHKYARWKLLHFDCEMQSRKFEPWSWCEWIWCMKQISFL